MLTSKATVEMCWHGLLKINVHMRPDVEPFNSEPASDCRQFRLLMLSLVSVLLAFSRGQQRLYTLKYTCASDSRGFGLPSFNLMKIGNKQTYYWIYFLEVWATGVSLQRLTVCHFWSPCGSLCCWITTAVYFSKDWFHSRWGEQSLLKGLKAAAP